MDYSSFYVKNYDKNKDTGLSNINYNNTYYQYYRTERDIGGNPPEIIYSQPIIVGAQEDVKDDIRKADYEYYPEPQPKKRVKSDKTRVKRKPMGKIRIAVIVLLCITISCLSTVLATDIMTSGQVIGAFKSAIVGSNNKAQYYVSYLLAGSDYESVKSDAEELRSSGLGGFAQYSEGVYRIYLDIATSKSDIISSVEGKKVYIDKVALSDIEFSAFDSSVQEQIKQYSDYAQIFLDYIGDAMSETKQPYVSEFSIRENIAGYAKQYGEYASRFISSVIGDTSLVVTKMITDIQIDAQALISLATGQNSPNLISDLRYYAIMGLFNYNGFCYYTAKA
ncbi:MAG: hypothetical protein K2M44_05795 [Clostridia bacterium]|nr:hypothetical protein [Clostridia bacterium]